LHAIYLSEVRKLQTKMALPDLEAPWKDIASRKRAQRDATIPVDWLLDKKALPKENGEPENVLSVPDLCGILTSKEIQITSQCGAASLVSKMGSRTLSAKEVTLAFCKRAAIAQQLTNCIAEPLFISALQRAHFLDQFLAEKGRPLGPLHGLPISMKDSFNITGVDSSIGLAALCFRPAKANSPLVDMLLSLGCVIIAKTNVPQTLAALDTNNNVFGRTLNPINRLVTAGGSSGGEGVLVAMKGSIVGVGTDIGGSIRVPAMCNGVYGFKPSVGRMPHGGQETGSLYGNGRVAIQAVTGPIARSVQDLDTFLKEVVPRAEIWGEDCVPGAWENKNILGSGRHGKFVIGVLQRDGNCEPLPPILKLLEEVKHKLIRAAHIEIVDIPTPPAWTKCQSTMNKLMSVDGATRMADLLEETGEPLVPWMQGRFKRGTPRSFDELRGLQAQRSELERQMLDVWYATNVDGSRRRKIDAIICPVAPHPVPPVDRWNAVGYTSSFVLLDYPAGVLPVRVFDEGDLELGREMGGKALGSWDDKNRQLWNESMTDRRVYLGTPLSVQVVAPKLHDLELCRVMNLIDRALAASQRGSKL
jgi:Asp-tRNA(Asn)/Glu-tRNA(Gln) amidotransferase A subunit family amidase